MLIKRDTNGGGRFEKSAAQANGNLNQAFDHIAVDAKISETDFDKWEIGVQAKPTAN